MRQIVFFSIPGLRPADVDRSATPTLFAWASQGALAQLQPTFPCVTSPVQATLGCGRPPQEHGVIANGFYHRVRREVEFWVGHNDVIEVPQIWNLLRAAGTSSAVWHVQNIKGANADYIVTPAPIHEPDGTTKLWCYSQPPGLYQQLIDAFGHFPLQHYWGPLANLESTRWILGAAAWLAERHSPQFHWIYIPHLDYAGQKFGPNSAQAKQALADLDGLLGEFAARENGGRIDGDRIYLVVGEYAITEVVGPVHPNRILRNAGLLAVREQGGREFLDLERSSAFAMVDHQLAHIYLSPAFDAQRDSRLRITELFRDVPGVSIAASGKDRKTLLGLDHPRCGEVMLVSDDAHWFTYYWWLDDAAAPDFARTVDIHRKPGYDPVELFFDPATKGIPLDAGRVKGSHGVPATGAQHLTALICSQSGPVVVRGNRYRDVDVHSMIQRLLVLEP